MTKSDAQKWLYESFSERNAHEISRGDAIDVKASVLLVALFYLTDKVFGFVPASSMPSVIRNAGLFALFVCIAFCLASLWPRTYNTEPMPRDNEEWVTGLEKWYENNHEAFEDEVRKENLERLKQRAEINNAISSKKMNLLDAAFYAAIFPTACYILLLTFRHI